MLIGPRRVVSLPAVTLLVCMTTVVYGRIRSREGGDLHSAVCSHCRAIVQPLPPTRSEQLPESSSDAVVESLERDLAEGKVEKAHDLLIEILKRPHLGSDLLLRVGIQFAERELYGEAAEAFQRCVQEHPAVFEAYYNLALADVAQQKWTESLATLKDAPQRSKAEVLACSYLRGKIEDAQGRSVEAQHDLSTAFVGAPQNQTYGLDLGLFYIRQHAYAPATGVFERAARFNPRSSFLLLGLSLARFLAGQQRQAVEDLKKLLAVEPDFSPAQLLMAFALFTDGKLEEAERVASQALNTPHPSPYLYYLDASILVKLQSRQYDRIFQELQIAQRAIPSCTLCYLTESKAYQAQGNVEAAIADLETAVRLDPDFPEAWYRLAALYRSVGRSTDASRAQDYFQELKADKEERENKMLRENFLQTLNASTSAH
jgi:tetratricopeptide (TPR) repeat protein